jgi:SAM-dependent methyltransferase
VDKSNRFRLFLVLAIALLSVAKLREFSGDIRLLYHRYLSDPQTIREYLEAHTVRKLQLGAGANNVPGWLNSDIMPEGGSIYLDATGTYPLADGSFHYIFAEHLIEHLSWEDGLKMLKECYRVLAPGGKLRIITPNLSKQIYALQNEASLKFVNSSKPITGYLPGPRLRLQPLTLSIKWFANGAISSFTIRKL